MPRIIINGEQLFEILTNKWDTEEEIKAWEHLEKNGFIFNEYMLVIKGDYFGRTLNIVYKVKVDGYGNEQKINIREVMIHDDGYRDITEITTTVNEFLDGLEKSIENQIKGKNKNKIFESDRVLAPMYFMRYCIKKAMNQEYIEIEHTNKKYKPISERKEYKKKNEYKLFEIIRKYQRHINSNRHNMKCEYWEVKGHFRHYKSGKVVYVKPFAKGKKKENYKDTRVYTL